LMSQTISDIQFGDRNPALLHIGIKDCWLRNEYSVRLIIMKLEQVVTHWNAILFQLVFGSTIYRPVCLFPYIKLRWNYNPVEFANEASQFQYVMGKSWPHSAANNYLYLFVWANLCILLILLFKPSVCKGPETELKCKTGFREPI
jgi:hypothetical protein